MYRHQCYHHLNHHVLTALGRTHGSCRPFPRIVVSDPSCTYIHTYKHTYIHTYKQTYIHTLLPLNLYTNTNTSPPPYHSHSLTLVTVLCSCPMVEVGLKATRMMTVSPLLIPPWIPPLLLVLVLVRPSLSL